MSGQLAIKRNKTQAKVHGKRPQYVKVADALTERVQNGDYPVDSFLPTEAELCAEFTTSRHTVREALRLLTNSGLIARRQGSGSRVLERSESASYVHSVGSFADIWREVSEAHFVANVVELVDTQEFSCPFIDLSPASKWVRVAGVRCDQKTGETLCHSIMFVEIALREAIESVPSGGDICQTLSEALGERVNEIQQEITVAPVPQEAAIAVGLETGAMTVNFTRCGLDDAGNLLVGSINFYPVDRFSYRMRLQRGD